VYDVRGRKVETHDPDAGTTRMVYDNADQLTSTTDARNATLAYTYDALGRKKTVHNGSTSNPALAGWFYDTLAKGQLDRSVRVQGGQTYQMKIKGYTDQYQPTGIDVVIPGTQLGGTYTTNYTYWVDGSPDTVAYGATGDLPQEGLHYEYDPITGFPLTLRATLGTTPLTYVTDTAYNALAEMSSSPCVPAPPAMRCGWATSESSKPAGSPTGGSTPTPPRSCTPTPATTTTRPATSPESPT
jgi:YD repeat-containing protein